MKRKEKSYKYINQFNIEIFIYLHNRIAHIIMKRLSNVWKRSNLLFWLFANNEYREFYKSVEILHEFTDSIIQQRRKSLDGKPIIETSNEIGIRNKMAFLDILLKSTVNGKPLSNEEIREEVDTFMFEVNYFVFTYT